MLHPGLRIAWAKFARPTPSPRFPWQSFFGSSFRRTLLNASRDNRWPRKPIYQGEKGKEFNWDAFRWTNYRVAGAFPVGNFRLI